MSINPSIFKAYDIRGVYPDEVNEEAAFAVGRAFVDFLKTEKVLVGRDIRKSSPSLFESLARGINDQGADIVDLGLCTTPMVYFATGRFGAPSIMITASHNPADYNGFKINRENNITIGKDSGMEDIKKMVLDNKFSNPSKKGNISGLDIKKEYLDYLFSFFRLGDSKFKIVIDTANAMSILELDIFRRCRNLDLVTLFDDFDGEFPNHEANPIKKETLIDLQKKVVSEKADLGIAFDGDGDRIGFVDEAGEIIPMDLVTAMIAKIILRNNKGRILIDLRSSMSVKEIIAENGGEPAECQVGHALIKKQMHGENAIFAGELSGHYYFKENYLAEAGSLPAIYLLNLMSETGKKISQLAAETKRYFHSGEINFEVKNKADVMEKLKTIYADGDLSELDGIKISYWRLPIGKRWWFNVRPSNTEPVLRLNLEADNKELMDDKLTEIRNAILE